MMNKDLPVCLLFLIIGTTSFAQSTIAWQKTLGGSRVDQAHSIQPMKDGGCIVAGWTSSDDGDVSANRGSSDGWIIKLDSSGLIEWEKTQGWSASDRLFDIQETREGGFILAGISETDYWILKLDINGDFEWERLYGGNANDYARSILQTKDGGYMVAGSASSHDKDVEDSRGEADVWVLKLDDKGNIEWKKSYGGSAAEFAGAMRETIDGGFVIAGSSASDDFDVSKNNGLADVWIIKLNEKGDLEWERSYGGSENDQAFSIEQTTDNGFIVSGRTRSNDGDVGVNKGADDLWILKLNELGNLDWEESYGGSATDQAHQIQQTKDLGFMVIGHAESSDGDVSNNNGSYDIWLLKLNNSGSIEWEETFGGSAPDYGHSISEINEGSYVIAGASLSKDGDISENKGSEDLWVIKLKPKSVGVPNLNNPPHFSVYPNPSRGEIFINTEKALNPFNVKVFDSVGKLVYSKNRIRQTINMELKQGCYFIHMFNSNFSSTKRINID